MGILKELRKFCGLNVCPLKIQILKPSLASERTQRRDFREQLNLEELGDSYKNIPEVALHVVLGVRLGRNRNSLLPEHESAHYLNLDVLAF